MDHGMNREDEPSSPDGMVMVPVEVLNLYEFMRLAFVPMTSQHEQINISLQLACAAMKKAGRPNH